MATRQVATSEGGASLPADSRTTPLVAEPPSVASQHPSQHDLFAKTGLDDRVALVLLQQHLRRQPEGVESKALAAIGASKEKDNQNAVHTATTLRSVNKRSLAPSIPGE